MALAERWQASSRMLIVALIMSLLLSRAAFAGDLSVTVTGVRNDRGSMMVALYDDETMFEKRSKPRKGAIVKAVKGESRVVFHDVSAGTYAVAVFHDENDNRRLDTNLLGMPLEGYGFSRNASGLTGPPSFENAAFGFDGISGALSIALRY